MDKYASGSYDCPASASKRAPSRLSNNNGGDEVFTKKLNFVDNLNAANPFEETVLVDSQALQMENNDEEEQYEDVAQEESLMLPSSRHAELNSHTIKYETFIAPPKNDIYSLLQKMINNYVETNVKISIGNTNFDCHMIVLQCYSKFFMDYDNDKLVRLPEKDVTPEAFITAYKWMLAEAPLLQREGIVELYKAAKVLRITDLVDQCWACMSDEKQIRDATAFFLFMDARKCGELENYEELMLKRICKFFTTLVATSDFIQLDVKHVTILLSSNTIGVNTEIEVFLSAVYWLDYNWKEREKYVLDLMKTVRFSLMPIWYLTSLTLKTDGGTFDKILVYRDVNEMIRDGISYNIKQRNEMAESLDLVEPVEQRQWIYDKQCSYHHRLNCPKMESLTYSTFLNYLQALGSNDQKYWQTLEFCNEKIECCNINAE